MKNSIFGDFTDIIERKWGVMRGKWGVKRKNTIFWFDGQGWEYADIIGVLLVKFMIFSRWITDEKVEKSGIFLLKIEKVKIG